MNTTKKLMTLLIAFMLPVIANAEDVYDYEVDGIYYKNINDEASDTYTSYDVYDFEVDGIYYKIINDEASVTYKSFSYIDHDPYYESDYAGDVVIPATVTYDGQTYPVTSIYSCAFYRRKALTSITIPNSITYIGWSSFFDCTGLTRVIISDLTAWCNIDIYFNSNPLYNAQHLYLNDTEVTDLVIPEGITEIDGFAFYGCVGLTSATIPNSVTSIGEGAFMECSQLSSITCLATTPPVIQYKNCFDDECYSNATLHVPIGTEMAYKTNQYWGQFLHIIGDVRDDDPDDDYEYVPFVREGVKWVYFYDNSEAMGNPLINPDYEPGKNYFNLELKGDTVINGKTYKAMHKYSGASINWENDTIPVYLREEDKIVYGIIPDGKKYVDCPVGHTYGNYYNGQEFVLYDFVDPVTWWDNFINIGWNDIFYFQSTDTISLGNQFAKRYYWKDIEMRDFYQVEGVGADSEFNGYTLLPYMDIYVDMFHVYFYLSHVIENGRIIYKGIHYVPGDVNGDGEVTIADANSVIDVVIMGGNAGHTRAPAADMDGNGEVNVTDLNIVIDLIIKGN
jgi:hypothetical protein